MCPRHVPGDGAISGQGLTRRRGHTNGRGLTCGHGSEVGQTERAPRRGRSVGAVAAIVAIVAVGLTVVAVSSADITNSTKLRSVDNTTAVTSGPAGSVLSVDVEYTIPSGGQNWESTRIIDADQSLCFDHADAPSGTNTESLIDGDPDPTVNGSLPEPRTRRS